ncbi:DUF6497 family protein [uncultured Marivita sp.]|uniref:DUF6497 family protein n=1 Tax=uncultured Marivita sp. TaxID=888080 RepID=UPI00261FAAE5|nr:DUF6497 family protein [uncultured Marivita sp.]
MARGGAWRCLTAGACALCGTAAFASGDLLAVPSEQPVTFLEMLSDTTANGLMYRFRFVAPEIGQEGREYQDVEVDMQFLCESFAIPRVADTGPQPSQIVISFSQKETEFGVANEDVIQFFEAYRIEDETCILEFF